MRSTKAPNSDGMGVLIWAACTSGKATSMPGINFYTDFRATYASIQMSFSGKALYISGDNTKLHTGSIMTAG